MKPRKFNIFKNHSLKENKTTLPEAEGDINAMSNTG